MMAALIGASGDICILDHGTASPPSTGHLSRFVVSDGQQVRRGDLIGFVELRGRWTGAHLHYEVWMNGRLTNPHDAARQNGGDARSPDFPCLLPSESKQTSSRASAYPQPLTCAPMSA